MKDATVGQRISRAKKSLAGADFELPVGQERERRLADVMSVIYLIFNEGYSATAGDDWMRPDLCLEGVRLARMLAHLEPGSRKCTASRRCSRSRRPVSARAPARTAPSVLLEDQDRRRWDQLLIRRGLAALERAEGLGKPVGPYVVQAEIAACHARARTAEQTDWARIAELYDVLADVAPGAVVEVNRAWRTAALMEHSAARRARRYRGRCARPFPSAPGGAGRPSRACRSSLRGRCRVP